MPSIFGLGETASLLLVIGIVSGIFAIVLLILTLVLVRGNKKKTTSLINNANRLHQIFVTLKRQKIARLEEISNINLLMIDTFNNVNNTYQELKKQYDIPMLSHVGQLKQLMDQKRKNDIHDTYYQLKDIYQEFETKVNNLDAELNLIFAPLETMQTEAMNVKNQTKLLKDDFLEQKDKLLQVEDIFVKSFALVETLFTRFDTLVDMGEFSEAKDLLLKIRNILAELRTSLDFLPQVLFEIEHNIPRKTSKIRMLRTLFLDKNIPLYHLNLDEVLNETAELLESMVVLLKQFKFEGIEAQIQNINTSLDELEAKILKEETEQQVFFSKKNVIIIESEALHKNLMDLGREIDKYKSYFLLEPAKLKDAVTLINEIPTLEQNRRLYDSAFYSEHPVPYSMMNEKTLKLQKIVDEGKLTYAKLNTYLKSLKQDAETAFNEIQPLYIALKEMEHKAASFSDITAQKIFDFVGDSYLKLGKLQGILKTVPLNITLVNELYQQLKAAVTSETIAITTLLTQKKAAMERLVFLNRARLDETVLDNATRDFERLFFDDHFGEIISKSEAFYKILREKKPIFEIE